MVDVIVSLTTTQARINKMRRVITRILNEQVGPMGASARGSCKCAYRVCLNIPVHLKNHVPDWLSTMESSHPNFIIHYCEKDYGPITKLFPLILNRDQFFEPTCSKDSLERGNHTWIVTIDDDILYDVTFVQSVYDVISMASPNLNLTQNVSTPTFPCAYAFSCVKWNRTKNIFTPTVKYTPLKSQHETTTTSLILEGYMGAIYNLACFYPFTQFIDYVNKSSGKNRDCFRSDDFVISYFLNKKETTIEQVQTPTWNKTKFWNNRRSVLLDYGKDKNALHANNQFFDRYKKAANFIRTIYSTEETTTSLSNAA